MNEIEELIKKNRERIKENEIKIEKGVYSYEESCLWRDNARLIEVNEDLKLLKESLIQGASDQREVLAKATEYDKLDHKFKLVCGKRVEQVLQHLCLFGFEDGITEQQALNKLAERFPMTIDQIVSTLEMSQTGANHEPVEVPELVAKYLDYARQCLDLNVLTVANYQNVKSNMGKIAADEVVHWAHEHPDEFMIAYQTGNYTVVKEPLYYVKLPRNRFNDEGGVMEREFAYLIFDKTSEEFDWIGSPFDGKERTTNITESIIKDCDERYWPFAVPVEEEAK